MSLFSRFRVGRPIPVAPPVGEVQFSNTSIFVRNCVIPQTSRQYASTVLQHLAEIQTFLVGQGLLTAITALGKRQVIRYNGPNNNSAAGGGIAAYKLLRGYHDRNDNRNFADELRRTLLSTPYHNIHLHWLANQLRNTPLPRWTGVNYPSPFGGRNVDLIEGSVDTWLAGTALPNRDEMDILCLVLEPWLLNGTGTNTLIHYDPHKVQVGGISRPPHVALFHELVHAYYNAAGGQLGREDSIEEANGGRLFELMAVGLTPFDTRLYGENQFRHAIGVGLRAHYP